jgi:hypothetical protein
MTERWRKKLEGIDGASPNDDVFDRAKQGPMHRDDAIPGPRMSTRIVTIVAAFVVFALAISVFAVPALRMGTEAGGQVVGLLPLWPAQTPDELEQLQAEAPAWALDPEQVALRFGQQVMGWSDVSVKELSGAECSDALVSTPWPGPSPYVADVLPCRAVSVFSPTQQTSPSFGYASSGPSATADAAFRTFAVLPCNPSSQCADYASGQQSVQLYQPLEQGAGQIWAVRLARGGLNLPNTISVAPGQNVHDGSSVSAGFFLGIGSAFTPTLAYASCGSTAASSAYHAPAGSGTGGIALDVHLEGSAECSGAQPGYVWAATAATALGSETGQIAEDPLQSDGPFRGGLLAFTAAPVTMVFPQSDAETTAPTSPTPERSASPTVEPVVWTTYDGGLGFTMELPADWGTTSIQDEIVVSAPEGDPYIQITRIPDEPPRDDSSFPLDFADYEGNNQPHFYGDGQTFIIQWLTGTPDPLTPEQSAIVESIVESIRFKPWKLAETRNGWTAVGEVFPNSTAESLVFQNEIWFATSTHGHRLFLGPAPACATGDGRGQVREYGAIGVECLGDGTSANWDLEGHPESANPPGFDVPLDSYTAIRAWDGKLIAQLPS